MTGLRLMNEIMDPATREATLADHLPPAAPIAEASVENEAPVVRSTARSRKVRTGLPVPPIPYAGRKVREMPQLAELWWYGNPLLLDGRHLGY